MLASAGLGKEFDHLKEMLKFIDFKGSDVRLETGSLLEGSRQPVPYPAPFRIGKWYTITLGIRLSTLTCLS